jgi:hypothetical protein
MPLFEMTSNVLEPVQSTTFAAEQVLERADLQRLLRSRIDMIVDGVMVVAEEFGAFTEARRRIDLLGVDRDGRLVVIELKRTTDGGHLELQALRYAAMVSVMTFDDLVEHHEHYLAQVEPEAVDEARARLADFLEDVGGEDAVLSREVRLVLVAAGFDREITTTVLWLTDVYGLDIRCVRLTPYKVAERLLLDVQQIIPLPEAGELTVQIRRKQTQARVASSDGRDWTLPCTIWNAPGSCPKCGVPTPSPSSTGSSPWRRARDSAMSRWSPTRLDTNGRDCPSWKPTHSCSYRLYRDVAQRRHLKCLHIGMSMCRNCSPTCRVASPGRQMLQAQGQRVALPDGGSLRPFASGIWATLLPLAPGWCAAR